MKYYAIIVAGGTGKRMKSELPKQFMLLNGKPIVMHTIQAFHQSDLHPEIILVLNPSYHSLWFELCRTHNFTIPCIVVASGSERFDSVKNGLDLIEEADAIVSVHDAVRPLVSNELINRTFKLAEHHIAVIPAVKSRDSIRKIEGDNTIALNREEILLVQTPQVFQFYALKQAYMQNYSNEFTDDASVIEKTGTEVYITEGDYRNIKITYQEDLLLAQLVMESI